MKEAFYDVERMMMGWSNLISQYPTQLYYSVLPFLPSGTYLARHYPTHTSGISILRGRDQSWSPLMFTLTGNARLANKAAFAPKGQIVALASYIGLDLFDALSGLLLSSIVAPGPDSGFPYGATFNADGSEVIVTLPLSESRYMHVVKYNVTRQSGRVLRTLTRDDHHWVTLSEGGSYVATPEFTSTESRILRIRGIRIWRTDGGDDTFISMTHAGDILGLTLSADSAHLLAVSTTNTLIISDMLSGDILQTLAEKDVEHVQISPDGSLVASATWPGAEIRLWSTTGGTLLATLEHPWSHFAFSHTNRLYTTLHSGGLSVYAVLAERDRLIPLSMTSFKDGDLIVAPNETQLAFQKHHYTQVWSLNHFGGAHDDSVPHSIRGIDLSSDGSLLAIRTDMEIEVWDARIDRCRYVIQSRFPYVEDKCIAFSPTGELIVSLDLDGIIVIDVRTGIIRPTTYSAGQGIAGADRYDNVGISFDCSMVSALVWGVNHEEPGVHIWDLPSGALLYTERADRYSRWSQMDLYMRFYSRRFKSLHDFNARGTYEINAKTFQKEIPPNASGRFRKHRHLRRKGNMLHIRSRRRWGDHLFLALPPHPEIRTCFCRGDRVCILSEDRRLLLLDVSGLAAYMKEFCDTESELGGELCVDLLRFLAK